ncbi:unnamed protein product [Paramecium sonneborni]|uniref:Mitochondrial import inner membrane translocase subunit TIM50 n=1 Tax=Paramecium sonneborni TaxID=65129 RepID=A0A8S1JY18_9CILI|nr:unnamed protein product [Paramecium sonneborni]
MFTSPNFKQLQGSIINKMKPTFEKGKSLPFKKESAPVKLNIQNNTSISTAQKSNRKPHQNLITKNEIPFQYEEFTLQRNQNKNVQTDGLFCLVKPIFQESKYYQSSLIHFHYEQVKQKQSPYKYYFELEYSSQNDKLMEYFKELFQEHFIQNYNCLQYCKKYSQNIQKNHKFEFLPGQSQEIQTLVFDLDETLIHCNDNNNDPTDYVIQIQLPNEGTVEARINIRPFCQQMLRLLSSKFELMLFTASYQYYADKVLELIDPEGTIFQYRFYRDSCIEVEDGLFVKDLRIIGNRKLENILLVDNASYSYCYQLDNGVPIIPFYDNKYDKELIFLTDYLMGLKNCEQWVKQNRMHFRTYFYQICTNGEECLKELFQAHDIVQD